MTALRIDGKAAAAALTARVRDAATRLRDRHATVPGLAAVLVGDDPASEVYVRNKGREAVGAGLASFEHRLSALTSQDVLLDLVAALNADPRVHGILVQLPLPPHVDAERVLRAVDPGKDVDGFHPENAGLLAIGRPRLVPCTPLGCAMLLRGVRPRLAGLHAVVVGRSNIVGKPMAQLLLLEDCTVTIAHSKTRDLPDVVRRGDIVVAAVGRPGFVRGDWLREGAIVVDVGINRVAAAEPGRTRLVGDVAYDEAVAVASAITPVPGGVGPMTIACLLRNTVVAAAASVGVALDLP